MRDLCNFAKEILIEEPNIQQIYSPITVSITDKICSLYAETLISILVAGTRVLLVHQRKLLRL